MTLTKTDKTHKTDKTQSNSLDSNSSQIDVQPEGNESPWRQIRSSLQQAVHDWSAVTRPKDGSSDAESQAKPLSEQLERQEIEQLLKELQSKLEGFSV